MGCSNNKSLEEKENEILAPNQVVENVVKSPEENVGKSPLENIDGNNEGKESDDDEPLIKVIHDKVEISNEEDSFSKGKDEIKWNDKNPIVGLTLKPTMYIKGDAKAVGKSNNGNAESRNIDIDQTNTISSNDIEIFDKLKTIGEEEENECAFLVKNSKTLSEFAYKRVDIGDKNNETAQKIFKEVEILKKLNHPNIIKLYQVNISNDNKYIEILTEFAEDGDLKMKLEENKEENKHFPESLLLDWLSQMCFALEYIHSQNILHRNIKPSSIFLMQIGLAKLGDFGMAKIMDSNGEFKRVKTIMPKIQCAAPELYEKKDFSTKTDIWYLGVTFFQLMTFNFPFKGKNDEEIMDSILEDERNEYNFHYSNDFKDLINKMISKEPEKRPSPTEILGMEFIKKRIESYLDENDCHFLKAKNTIGLFDDLEEIESEFEEVEKKDENINSNKKDEEKKEEEKKDEDKNYVDKKEEKKIEDNTEIKNKDKKPKKQVRFIIEDIKDDNNNDNKNKYKKSKTKKRSNIKPLNSLEIKERNEKNAKKKIKRNAYDLMRQMTNMRELLKNQKTMI